MEREIGADLVERRPGDIVLTEIGLDVARRGEHILAATRDLVDFARHREVLSGQLKLGIIPTLAPYILPRLLPLLQTQYPQLQLEVRETQTKILLDELAIGALDAVMLALPAEAYEVETLPLFTDAFLLAVPATDPLPPLSRVEIADVDQRRLILLEEGHCLRDQALAFCATKWRDQPAAFGASPNHIPPAGQVPPAGLGATSLATVMQMVANGYGVTLVPEVSIDAELRDARIKLLRFSEPEPSRSIGLAWRQTSPRKADFQALGGLVTKALAAA